MTRRKDPLPDAGPTDTGTTEAVAMPASVDPSGTPASDPFEPPPPPDSPVDPAPASTRARGSGVVGPLLGGAIAALGGFALSHFNVFGLAPKDAAGDLAALSQSVARLQDQDSAAQAELSALASRVAKMESLPAPPQMDMSRLDDLEKRLGAITTLPADSSAATAALAARLSELEGRVEARTGSGSSPDLQAKLDEALARLDAAEGDARTRTAEADAAKAAADRGIALDALSDAVASGSPFAAELQALDDQALTEALGPLAERGVLTLDQLQAGFPHAARDALRIARDLSTADGWGDRLVDFLATQTGARSLSPREGSDPDAVLSRAEFALSEGRLADTLAALQALDPAIRAPLEAWSEAAQAHLAARTALQSARGE